MGMLITMFGAEREAFSWPPPSDPGIPESAQIIRDGLNHPKLPDRIAAIG